MTYHFDGTPDLMLDPDSTLVLGAKYIKSPNFDLRPNGVEISLLVIHSISLPPNKFSKYSLKHITNFFTNKLDPDLHPYFKEIYQLKVSCHCFISRAGKLIQFVPFKYRAWHAGRSNFSGQSECNDFSIGIELEGCDTVPYAAVQYNTLAKLIKVIMKNYPKITPSNIVGHCDIAPDRKTDPGPVFNWKWLIDNL